MIVTLAGHVDHGKTAVVQALTGINTDRLKEEQARGLTIDLGFAYTNFGNQRIGFVDVPGHHRFIHNMIAGVGKFQHALLIVAADDGIMPQTIEHIQIMELMGIQYGTIVLNKTDLVSQDVIQDRLTNLQELAQACFLRSAKVFQVSATERSGIDELREHLRHSASSFQLSFDDRPFRLAIDRSFSLRGAGTIVTGTVSSGTVGLGESLHLTSSNSAVRVRGINVQGETKPKAIPGDRASINLVGSNVEQAHRGAWLLASDTVFPTRYAQVHLNILDDFPRRIKHRSPIHIYHLTDHCEGTLVLLEKNSAEPGAQVLAELECSRSMQFKVGDKLVLRDRDLSRTLAGAQVISASADKDTRRRKQRDLSQVEALIEPVQHDDFKHVLEVLSSNKVADIHSVRLQWNRSQSDLDSVVNQLALTQASNLALSSSCFEEIKGQIFRVLEDYHQRFPDELGLNSQDLNRHLNLDSATLEFVLKRLASIKALNARSGVYALRSHKSTRPSYDEKLYKRFLPLIDQSQPMSVGDIAKHCNLTFDATQTALKGMVAAQVFVQVSKNRVFTKEHFNELVNHARGLSEQAPFTVKDFRDKTTLGRNLVIDLLEYFDRQRITKRQGDTRVTLPPPSLNVTA